MFEKLYILLIIVLFIFPTSCTNDNPPIDHGITDQTILIYMVATNSLNKNATDDINEIIASAENFDLNKNKILVYQVTIGNKPKLLQLTKTSKGYGLQQLIEYNETTSSVSPQRIKTVLKDMKNIAPANSYGLFLWSHALNWIPSKVKSIKPTYFGDDYGSHIDITELADALDNNSFSFIWMDCCFMGSIEVAYQLRNNCKYFVAYPTEVLSFGVPYNSVLPEIINNKSDNMILAAKKMMSDYRTKNKTATIAVIDMDEIESLADCCSKIYAEFEPIDPYGLQKYTRTSSDIQFFDFKAYTTKLAQKQKRDILLKEFETQLNRVVVYKDATDYFLNIKIDLSQYSGLSVYALMNTDSTIEIFYKSLDWYKRIFTNE